jgi:hypothetical protein
MEERLSAQAPAALYFPETLFSCFWYSFLLEAEWTPESSAAGGIRYIEKKFIHLMWSGTRDLPVCSIVP